MGRAQASPSSSRLGRLGVCSKGSWDLEGLGFGVLGFRLFRVPQVEEHHLRESAFVVALRLLYYSVCFGLAATVTYILLGNYFVFLFI